MVDVDVTRTRHPGPEITASVPSDASADTVPQVRSPSRYRVLGEHGRGGLGKVSRARDRELGRDVAIKELLSPGALHEVRFLREALITARLEHPAIVPVHEAGRWPDGTPFYTMKLVAGRPLRDLLAKCKAVEDRLALLHHVIAVTDAIAYAHGRRIIHRDLKPSNVIIGEFGETVVIDWGLAKDLSSGEESIRDGGSLPINRDDDLTSAGTVMGTPAYMAPEQQRGEPVDERADVYAIGAMLWELCSIERLPPGYSGQRRRILRESGIDPDLIAIIDKALAPDRDRRYRDAGALASDLKAFKAGARIGARRYSAWGVLVHWTRRHRALALSVTAMIVLASAGSALYIRNITAERDRAQRERDRARLSEISLLLEKDPTRARDLLEKVPRRSPRHSLLTSLARQLAATHVVSIPGRIVGLFPNPGGDAVDLAVYDGRLYRVDPSTGATEILDRDMVPLNSDLPRREGRLLHARRDSKTGLINIVYSDNSKALDQNLTEIQKLISVEDTIYTLDTKNNLLRHDGQATTIVDHDVRNVIGGGQVRMICTTDNKLEVVQNGEIVLRARCLNTNSVAGMAATRAGFAVITDEHSLIAVRDGHRIDIPTPIRDEYEMAMSNTGLIAIVDYSPQGTSWFVTPGGVQLEAGPAHTSQPFSVATDGALAAWGYSDGVVVALDTRTGRVWKLRGHSGPVNYVAVDAAHARIVATGTRELRVWDLQRTAASPIASTHCVIQHIEPSPSGELIATDCNNGEIRIWSRITGVIKVIRTHVGSSSGIQWVNSQICSRGEMDGRIVCSNPDGQMSHVTSSSISRTISMISNQHHTATILATSDGKIWHHDSSSLRELYTHRDIYQIALSENDRYLAGCAFDGSLTVFDLVNHQLIAYVPDHVTSTCEVAWIDDEVWTAGRDGEIKRWVVRGNGLHLQDIVRVSDPVLALARMNRGWVASAGQNILMIGADATVTRRIHIGKIAKKLAISPDQRYIAALTDGEITVLDIQRNAIATTVTNDIRPLRIRFLDGTTLAYSESLALGIVRLSDLDYVAFDPASTEQDDNDP